MNGWEGTERDLTKVLRESVGSELTANFRARPPAGNTPLEGTGSTSDEAMSSCRSTEVTPIWFGSVERPLFGMFHVPESGFARAGVVVCPPFGRDLLHAHYTLRCLGDEMTTRGICTLRFDYDGTGDSAGTGNDPQRVRSWLDSISSAVATMRSSGVESVFVVGMGLGATLAAQIVEADEEYRRTRAMGSRTQWQGLHFPSKGAERHLLQCADYDNGWLP